MNKMNRRQFAGAVLGGVAGGVAAQGASAQADGAGGILIVGVACSPRAGMTTAGGVKVALDAAREADPRVRTELLDLGGKRIAGWSPAIEEDDFDALLPTLRSEEFGGLIIGSPVYFRTLSSLCKAFIERLAVLRAPQFMLADKPVGVLTVGAYRNGGQELAINEILSAMLCHEMLAVGGRAPALQGATLLSSNDSIAGDELGLESARKLGQRVAQAAVQAMA